MWSKQLVYIGNANWGKGSLASGLGRLRIGGGVRMCLEESPALSDTCPGFLWDLIVIRYYVECFSNFPSP